MTSDAATTATTTPAGPFAADPDNPTDAELIAAINRGLADGSILTLDAFLTAAADLD